MTGDHKKIKSQGMVMLYAVIVLSVMAIVIYAVSELAFKETALSLIGKNSQIAFYAANSGIECATYGDTKLALFSSPLFEGTAHSGREIECAEGTISYASIDLDDSDPQTHKSTFTVDLENGACTVVEVVKTFDGAKLETSISADGYHRCSGNNRIQRTIEVHY